MRSDDGDDLLHGCSVSVYRRPDFNVCHRIAPEGNAVKDF